MTIAPASSSDGRVRVGGPEDLQPGARALLDAAKRLLRDGGFDALRIEAIAREAGLNKAMIRYYFGDKAGLVAALVDDLLHEVTVGLVAATETLPVGEPRLRGYVEGTRRVMAAPGYMDFFDVLPHALRDEPLRRRIAELYVWYREMNTRCFDVDGTAPDDARLSAIAALVVAAVDGLAIQAALAPDTFDVEGSFAALQEAVVHLMSTST